MKKLLCVFLVFAFSCSDIIEVEDISNKTVIILAPTNEAVLNTTSVIFTWNNVDDAEDYKLQIATPSFENATQVLTDSTLAATNFLKTLEVGSYEWRIRAENSEYQTNYSTQSFTIEE